MSAHIIESRLLGSFPSFTSIHTVVDTLYLSNLLQIHIDLFVHSEG